jgi:hypothetical protein
MGIQLLVAVALSSAAGYISMPDIIGVGIFKKRGYYPLAQRVSVERAGDHQRILVRDFNIDRGLFHYFYHAQDPAPFFGRRLFTIKRIIIDNACCQTEELSGYYASVMDI